MDDRALRVGVITQTHGLRGEVKVFPTTDEPQRFLDLEEVIFCKGRQEMPLRIRSARLFKQLVILSFEGRERIEDVQALVKGELFVRREDALELSEDEYYISDLIGLKVTEEDGGVLGKVTDVIQTGANEVYVVQTGDGEELLLPAIHSCILSVNVEEGLMIVRVPKGLR